MLDEESKVLESLVPNSKIYEDAESQFNKCIDHRSQIFVQFACEESAEQSYNKYVKLSKISCILSFVGVVFSLTMWYKSIKSSLDQQKIDMKHVTADDYTIQLKISEEQLDNFKKTNQ